MFCCVALRLLRCSTCCTFARALLPHIFGRNDRARARDVQHVRGGIIQWKFSSYVSLLVLRNCARLDDDRHLIFSVAVSLIEVVLRETMKNQSRERDSFLREKRLSNRTQFYYYFHSNFGCFSTLSITQQHKLGESRLTREIQFSISHYYYFCRP